MLTSMTGYGSSYFEGDELIVKAEVKSINSKVLDLKMRLPSRYFEKEIDLQNYIEKEVSRGKVDLIINIKFKNTEIIKRNLNHDLVKSYYEEITKLSKELETQNPSILNTIINFPDIFTPSIILKNIDETEWNIIHQTIDAAITELKKFRKSEGEKLAIEIINFLENIKNTSLEIELLKDKRAQTASDKLKGQIANIYSGQVDNDRFEQELIYYLEKFDITEELDRLKTHINYFLITMDEEECGRKLGFISQEIGREINTLGSKANDSEIQKKVVFMKNELEKIKQQLANIL